MTEIKNKFNAEIESDINRNTMSQLTSQSGPFFNNCPEDLIYNLKTPKQQF